jgi:hypothetical protein
MRAQEIQAPPGPGRREWERGMGGTREASRDGDGGTLGVGFVSFSVFLAYEFLE